MAEQEKLPHLATDPNGFMRGCRCDLTEDHDVAAFGPHQFVAGGPVNAPEIRVAELRPRGLGKTAEAEADRAAWHAQEALTDAFVSNAMRVHVQHTEQTLKEMIRRAIELVEENPRNEPMRTPVSRPAVERMLAEDLGRSELGRSAFTDAGRAELAKELFDDGWRPTIDRLVR